MHKIKQILWVKLCAKEKSSYVFESEPNLVHVMLIDHTLSGPVRPSFDPVMWFCFYEVDATRAYS